MRAPSGFPLSRSVLEAYQRYGVAAIGTAKAQDLHLPLSGIPMLG